MQRTTTIRFLTTTTNNKGDLFTRLMKAFFRAMGYDDIRCDVQKSGREIDIEGRHRHAPRLLRAECKAHEDKKMGGTELNTFFGAVTRERRKTNKIVDAYFVSLSGFTAPSETQEEETGDDKLILLDSLKVIAELEQNGLLPDDAAAAEQAGQCAGRAGLTAGMLDGIELLAYEKGYAKAVYYAEHHQRTHFALIHADGTPLGAVPAQEVIDADQAVGGSLHELHYLAPAPVVANQQAEQEAALAHYQRWLNAECAYIQLDGLPATTDVSSSKLKLERLFVPAKAIVVQSDDLYAAAVRPSYHRIHRQDDDNNATVEGYTSRLLFFGEPIAISDLLEPQARIALLSPPGGGKSTLLKRLATEYGFTDQLVKFADEMPAHDWLPLVMRCRDLQDQAKEPFIDILEKLPKRLSMLPAQAAAFKTYLHESLQLGRVLLLIDGLDEIANESNRKLFTKNLLSFLTLFPQVSLVLTSREAGFRFVADVVASECTSYTLAPFDEADVQRLCVQWHAEVINNSEEVRQKALKLAKNIWDNEHIRGLATNPLLLTTLLVVNRRRGGELPKNRIMLYSKAVEVLIQTWNAEVHAPLDEEETLTQLSYLACYMMEKGIQQIGKRELIQTLREAQRTIPELRYSTTTPINFIKQVEYRSSLLMQVGSNLFDGEEQEVFEFRHLTFQEYLAARGYVEGYHPRDKEGLSLAELLSPHFGHSVWREVIPLAAVLAKRRAEELMALLVRHCANLTLKKASGNPVHTTPLDILRRCIADEVIISSDATLRSALLQLGRLGPIALGNDTTRSIMGGKHAGLYQQLIEDAFLSGQPDWHTFNLAFRELNAFRVNEASNEDNPQYVEQVLTLLREGTVLSQLRGLAALAELGFTRGLPWHQAGTVLQTVDANLEPFKMTEGQAVEMYQLLDILLHTEDERVLLSVCETFAQIPGITLYDNLPLASSVAALFKLVGSIETNPFASDSDRRLYGAALQALKSMRVLDRDALLGEEVGDFVANSGKKGELDLGPAHRTLSHLLILAAWYRLFPLEDKQLLRWIDLFFSTNLTRLHSLRKYEEPVVSRFLRKMGEAGEQLLVERAERRKQANKPAEVFKLK